MTELKPCPFCGGEAKFVEGVWSDNEICYVQCVDCRAGTNVCDTQDEAVTNWNTRPSPWNTGKPTEEGWYLFKFKDKTGLCWYKPEYLTIDTINKLAEWHMLDDCKWQKIEETD